jgi:tetratricopeptide (TPR) repeat protein
VLDFGVARAVQLDAEGTTKSLTDTAFAGTIPYMAPEQVRGGPVDYRTDIYGAGAVLYEMATGSRVHPGLTGARLLGAILEEPLLSARSLNPRVSPALEAILSKALDKDPALRYQSAREMQVDLERLAAPSKVASAPLPVRRRRRPVVVAALAVAVVAAIGWLLWSRGDPFTGRILVADFEDRAGDPELALVIRDLLTRQLQQSRDLNVLTREHVLDALGRMERRDPDQLDHATALELAEREAVHMVLAGTVHKRGETVLIEVSGIDPVNRKPLFTAMTEYRPDGDLLRQIGSLAGDLRRRLGESSERIAQNTRPLEEVTSGSTDAVRLYSRGAEAARRGDADEARRLLSTALELDPDFAMAHRLMARVYGTSGNAEKQREHLEQAYKLRERLTRREQLHVEASYFNGAGEYEKAVASLTAAISLFPADADSRYELALAYRDAGYSSEAIKLLEDALEASPLTTGAYGEIVLLRARVGDYGRARTTYDEARRRKIGSPKLEWAYGMVLLGEGRIADARSLLEPVTRASGTYGGIARLFLAAADILEGKLHAASRQLESDLLSDSTEANDLAQLARHDLLARVLLLRGLRADARRQLDIVLSKSLTPGTHAWQAAGTLLVALGDLSRAQTLSKQSVQEAAAGRFAQSSFHSLRGEIALAEGRTAEAVTAFSAAALQYPRALTTRARARALAAQGDHARARAEWKQVIAAKGELLREHFALEWVMAHLELARSSRALGDLNAARAEYDAFLTMWKGGDDLPVLQAAAAERRALSSQ